jgi:CRP-like cAMP-binding protein
LGELSLLHHASHSADVRALESTEAAVIEHEDLNRLIQTRSDIGCILYRNLAIGLGDKLKRSVVGSSISSKQ